MSLRLWGWYDDSTQSRPSYDPPHDAPCPYCLAPLTADDVRTICVVLAEPVYAKRSYFYRTHRTCDDAAKARGEVTSMDGRIFDAIGKTGD
jgi:hypothetical protein